MAARNNDREGPAMGEGRVVDMGTTVIIIDDISEGMDAAD